MEITSAGVSVFEVVLNLKQWEGVLSHDIPGFAQSLIDLMPTTANHKCISGQKGGFHTELIRGTNFGHVVEHVLLELIHLAYPNDPEYTGWTKSLGDGKYVIHYGAPDFLTGRLAAILAVEIVSDLQRRRTPDFATIISQVQHPRSYFSRESAPALDLIDGLDAEDESLKNEPVPELTSHQYERLSTMFQAVSDSLPGVHLRWAAAFRSYGGEFARGVQDKVELIHPDRSLPSLIAGDFTTYFHGVTNFCRMMRTLRIPLNFVSHACWLFKNLLQVVVLDYTAAESIDQDRAIADLDDFYQNVFHQILVGFSILPELEAEPDRLSVCGFRSRRVRRDSVLVVDDDVMARRIARNILRHHNISTRGARDGLEALQILAEDNAEIGLVLLDLVMPGTPGEVVCRRIREAHPNMKIILCSGFSIDGSYRNHLIDHEVCFLGKPFKVADLVNMVRELMDFDAACVPPSPAVERTAAPPY